MRLLFVTGTSTGVGKTVVTAALAATAAASGRTVAVCKPAQTGVAPGEPGDLADIERLSGVTRTLELARYPDPLAPDTAARRRGLPELTLSATVRALAGLADEVDLVLVEGAGGLLVRLGDGFTVVELAQSFSAPVLVVTSIALGTLNHSELTTRTLAAERVDCAGLVIGAAPREPDMVARCNEIDLPRLTGVEIVGAVPDGAGAWNPELFAATAPAWFDEKLFAD